MGNLLPLGSVVLLKKTDERAVIIGRMIKEKETGIIHQYAGCLYPKGCVNSNQLLVFDTNDIQMLLAIGYQNSKEIQYRKAVEDLLEKGEL